MGHEFFAFIKTTAGRSGLLPRQTHASTNASVESCIISTKMRLKTRHLPGFRYSVRICSAWGRLS